MKQRKKKGTTKKIAIPLLVLGALALSSLTIDYKSLFPGNSPAASFIQDSGSMDVYFCPRENCETALIEFLDSAAESIHCALFDVGLPSVQQTLLAKSQAMEVQVVTDNDYLYKFNHSFVKADSWGLMHNKFCIVDGTKVSAGSMNPTLNDAHKNNNNLLLIESRILAQNYEDEFQEMWNGEFKKGDTVRNPGVKLDNVLIKNHFCPEDLCAERVKEELQTAQKSIYFMTFSFTNDGIANVLLLKHLQNISIKGVMEARQVTKYSKFAVLQYQIGDVYKDANKQNMHHKVFIIDNRTVVTGSFNPTQGGDERNDENILIIEDEEIAKRFVDEFLMVYGEAQN